jgi:hypothetical protein
MTDNENLDDIPVQFITLDNEHTAAVFVDAPGGIQVFVDVSNLIHNFVVEMIPMAQQATAEGNMSNILQLQGARWVLGCLNESANMLRAEAEIANLPETSEVTY